uniref:SET domain-containing protein n=1 Tax=Anopheles dirus TaxID=7168 RepID=A0A182NSN7_9DIPT
MGERSKVQNACVIVLGDIGRSPRMQYHVKSLSENDFSVDFIGYVNSTPLEAIRCSPNVRIHELNPFPELELPNVLKYVFKTVWQALGLLITLISIRKPKFILCQNPPAIPAIIVAYLYCLATVLYDRPPQQFQSISIQEKHNLFVRLSENISAFNAELSTNASDSEDIVERTAFTEKHRNGEVKFRDSRPGLLISSTSWTPDEDFSMLLSALDQYEREANSQPSHYPDLVCIITGKGPLKEKYRKIVGSKPWKRVTVEMPWLENEDYPKLLASSDLGVCLHYSSSGLDLPMKVVDMFGSGLPVCAVHFDWKMHYPPETCGIMLFVKIVGLFRQAVDPQALQTQLQDFVHKSVNEDLLIFHKMLGEKFTQQIEQLYELFRTAFCVESDERLSWLTLDGFKSLIALVGTNGQGIGTSSFGDWVKNVTAGEMNEKERQVVDELIDDLYSKMDDVVGTFLNNEGSALYAQQSKVNHSCAPNAETVFPNSNHVLALRATRDIQPGEEICISYLDESNYKVELYDPRSGGFMPSSPGIGMHVEIKDPDDKTILSRVYSSEGRISFTSHIPGEHVLCMYSNSTAWFSGSQLRVHLDIQVGEHTIDYANVAQKEKLTELQLRIRQLLDQVDQITKEQNYQRYREERFRQTSDSTNQRVLWWSLAQTLVLLVMGFWQMRHLKSFFEAKKLV